MATFDIEVNFRDQRFDSISAGLTAFGKALKSDWDGSARVLSQELREFLNQVSTALAQRHGGAWPGGTTETSLSKRTGALIASIAASVNVTGETFDAIMGSIGSDVPYAAIQEYGGTIHAKNAQFLAIPLPPALDAQGVPLMMGPRAWPNTFVAKSKAGNLIIFQRRGTSIVPLYVLKTSVTIPPRLGLRTTIDAGLGYFQSRAADAIVQAMTAGASS